MGKLLLGFNCNCFSNRYDEPEEWTRLCAQMGIRHVMFSADLIDPYWPWDTQRRLCDRTLEACARHGVSIRCSFGGHNHHQHYLGHPIAECRRAAEEFFRRAIRQTAYLGGASFGTCFAIQSARAHSDPALRAAIMEDAIAAYHRLAGYAAEEGLRALAYEMTSVPRETCATFAENDDVLERCADMAVPLRVCLDMGHRNPAGLPAEADHLAWIRRYAGRCDVIDCQQTDRAGSRHWPFTPEHNAQGIIRGEEIVAAFAAGGALADPADGHDILLAFEIRTPAFYPAENGHLAALEASVVYWRQFVRD